jgi:hypothetical protein
MVDNTTGRRRWSILGQPVRHPTEQNGLYFRCSTTYPVARLTATLEMSLVAVEEGQAGVRLVVNFVDSMGWDVTTGEMLADTTMCRIAGEVQQRFGSGTGWYMIKGRWRIAPKFGFTYGAPPECTPLEQSPTPDIARLFAESNRYILSQLLPPSRTAEAVQIAMSVLQRERQFARWRETTVPLVWKIEHPYRVDHEVGPSFTASQRFLDECELWVAASTIPAAAGPLIYVTIAVADAKYWASPMAKNLTDIVIDEIQEALGRRFQGVKIAVLPPVAV